MVDNVKDNVKTVKENTPMGEIIDYIKEHSAR